MSIFKLFGKGPKLPEWASVLNDKQYQAMWKAARAWVKNQGFEAVFNEDEGWLRPSTGFMADHAMNLHNLVPAAAQLQPSQVEAMIQNYFQGMWDRAEENAWALAQGYDRLAPLLRLRIFPADVAASMSVTIQTPISPYLSGLLFMDLPKIMSSVTEDIFANWEVNREEALAQARKQTEEEFMGLIAGKTPLPAGEIFAIHRPENFLVAAGILVLDRLFDPAPRGGVVVTVPTRSYMLGLAIEEKVPVSMIEGIGAASLQASREQPGPVTPLLFWWHEGVLHALHEPEVWARFNETALL